MQNLCLVTEACGFSGSYYLKLDIPKFQEINIIIKRRRK
jgi:hypothetical protein